MLPAVQAAIYKETGLSETMSSRLLQLMTTAEVDKLLDELVVPDYTLSIFDKLTVRSLVRESKATPPLADAYPDLAALGKAAEVGQTVLDGLGAALGCPLTVGLDLFQDLKDDEATSIIDNMSIPDYTLNRKDILSLRLFFASTKAKPVPPPTLAVSAPSTQSNLVPAPATAAPPQQGSIRHSLIINQLDERVAFPLEPDRHLRYLAKYEAVYGPDLAPPPEVEPTAEQLAVLHNVLESGGVPYCDFALFGPASNRTVRKLRLHGQTLSKDPMGQPILIPVEIAGPPDLSVWLESWSVFATSMIMLDAADLGILDLYKNRIVKLHGIFSEGTWLLLYQTDVRARLEQLPRIRLQLLREHNDDLAEGRNSSFDPKRPWNSAFKRLLSRSHGEWWYDTFERHATLVVARVRTQHSFVEGDAPVRAANQPASAAAASVVPDVPRRPTRTPPPPPTRHPVDRKKARIGTEHRVADGRYTHNRQGKPLCHQFQTGSCQKNQGSCNYAHQCDRCLDNRHGAHCNNGQRVDCTKTPADTPSHNSQSVRGRGRGGRGRGRR